MLRNETGLLTASPLIGPTEKVPDKNALMRLFTVYRAELCEALMHSLVLVPEGLTEFRWFRGLFRACVTAEGLERTNLQSPAALAPGVLPTQDSSVVATFRQLCPLVSNLVPIVDGDKAGREYAKQLAQLAQPPSRIVRLADETDLEAVLAWILLPGVDQAERWQLLPAELLGSEPQTSRGLLAALRQAKTRWSLHDELLGLISSWPDSAERARRFLGDVVAVAMGETPDLATSCWQRENPRAGVELWIWQVPEGAR